MTRNLARFLRPRSIAVIGGGAWCRNVVACSRGIGFLGEIWPVHPKWSDVDGEVAFSSVGALPGAPDAVFVGVNRAATIDVVAQLASIGAGGAVCFASGFLEAQAESGEGAALQNRLLQAAGDMPLIGPNCYGVLNFLDGAALWPDQHGGQRVESGVALITQSSNVALNLTMQRRGLPLAFVATTGNQAQTGMAELGMAMLEDPRVTALGLHVEGIGDLRALEALAARAARLEKGIVALKVGRSDEARAATVSHTASLAGNAAGAQALFERLGIGQVRTLPALVEVLKLLHVAGPLTSGRIASLSCSGGEAGLVADAVHGTALRLPALSSTQQKDLRAALGPMVALANPLDYHTFIWGDVDALTCCFSAMMAPSLAMGVVILDFPRLDRCRAHEWDAVLKAVVAAKRESGVPMGVLATFPENMPEEIAETLVALGVVPFCGLSEAVEAMDIAARMGRAPPDTQLVLPVPPDAPKQLSELEAKHMLAGCGIRVPRSGRVQDLQAVARKAVEIGFPVVLKGEGFAHKTEAGAVALNLVTAGAVVEAADAMPCSSWLIEEMVTGTVAELLVGVVRDPAHGFLLTLAAGGTLTELLEDSASLLLPVSVPDIRAALKKLKVFQVLAGYRGRPAANLDAITDVILSLQALVETGAIEEIEINPLMCTQTAAIAADALIRTGDPI